MAQPLFLPLLEGEVIRLVELMPGTGDDPISLRLLIAELGYHPEYEAVSYVWGDARRQISISCNGRPLRITVSLNEVFKRVRYPDRSRLLWADAVCINQMHDGERSHHVGFMGEVYKQAKRVLVYFGDDVTGNASHVSSLVKEYAELVSRYRSVHEMPVLSATDSALDDPRWKALCQFINLSWWVRAWVIQEVGLAREPICLYGKEEFDYRDLMKVANWTTRCAPQLELRHGVTFATVHTDWMDWSSDWRDSSPDPSQTFLSLMNHSRWLSCKEKKDHIYALLGHPLAHIEPGNQLLVQPAYSKTDEEVYVELAGILIRDHGLRILSPVDHDEATWKGGTVPSWVPFYHNLELTECNFGVFPDFWYDASTGSTTDYAPIVEANYLQVQGLVVDTVRECPRLTESPSSDDGTFSQLTGLNDLQVRLDSIMAEALTDNKGQAYEAEDKLDALSLTLCAGLSRYRCAEDDLDQHHRDFAAWRRIRSAPVVDDSLPGSTSPNREGGDYERFVTDMKMVCQGRTFLFTERGRYGLGPMIASPDDLCCVFFGATVPFILRKTDRSGHYKLIGEAYVHGLMRGEALRSGNSGDFIEQTFILS